MNLLIFISTSYLRDDVYNAGETDILYLENFAPGFKVNKDRITFMECGNKSGSHSLKLMVIGKRNQPCCFKNVFCKSVSYKSQSNSWMTTNIFLILVSQ